MPVFGRSVRRTVVLGAVGALAATLAVAESAASAVAAPRNAKGAVIALRANSGAIRAGARNSGPSTLTLKGVGLTARVLGRRDGRTFSGLAGTAEATRSIDVNTNAPAVLRIGKSRVALTITELVLTGRTLTARVRPGIATKPWMLASLAPGPNSTTFPKSFGLAQLLVVSGISKPKLGLMGTQGTDLNITSSFDPGKFKFAIWKPNTFCTEFADIYPVILHPGPDTFYAFRKDLSAFDCWGVFPTIFWEIRAERFSDHAMGIATVATFNLAPYLFLTTCKSYTEDRGFHPYCSASGAILFDAVSFNVSSDPLSQHRRSTPLGSAGGATRPLTPCNAQWLSRNSDAPAIACEGVTTTIP